MDHLYTYKRSVTRFFGILRPLENGHFQLFFSYFGHFKLNYWTFKDEKIGFYECKSILKDAKDYQGIKKTIF